ncbi:hypothetical protein [Streptomyces triticirhizae]|uniref:Uncharacterized protein n=1 Tax=Streptomyces triticirhizae TaxID=2483353 RepID=A0A3M2LYL6_9ACTN|nr:hypothetical protein [Streptomyces triticirhizae]RMI42030.1 hypothetical protein EBN88_09920 [Streptomyces triticirhizae]
MPFSVSRPVAAFVTIVMLGICAAVVVANEARNDDSWITKAEIIMVYVDRYAPPAEGGFQGGAERVIA